MGNLAFTSVLFLLLALPGYLAIMSYHSGEFTRHLLPRSWTDDVIRAILWSIPFHCLTIATFILLKHFGLAHYTLNLEAPLRILMGQYAEKHDDLHSLSSTIGLFYENGYYVGTYYMAVLGSAFALGYAARKMVWDFELDIKLPALFRFNSDFLYDLLGRGKLYKANDCLCLRALGVASKESVPHERTLVFLDALTDLPTAMPGKGQLYRGIVIAFTLDDKGALSEIVLTKAKRGKFQKVPGTEKYDFTLEEIPGTRFILKYSGIKNLNATYLPAPPE